MSCTKLHISLFNVDDSISPKLDKILFISMYVIISEELWYDQLPVLNLYQAQIYIRLTWIQNKHFLDIDYIRCIPRMCHTFSKDDAAINDFIYSCTTSSGKRQMFWLLLTISMPQMLLRLNGTGKEVIEESATYPFRIS